MDKQPVNEADWDYLIVLDACRYDYFEDLYEEYLDGDLAKVRSRGSATPEWLRNTFKGRRYKYTYITANPYINKQNNALGDLVEEWDIEWHADDKFTEVKEAWVHRWDDEIGTVKPEDMREFTQEEIEEDQGKTIIHFIQPHRPFISYEGDSWHTWSEKGSNDGSREFSLESIVSLTRPIWKPVFYSLPKKYQYRIRGFLGKTDQYREFAEELGEEKVKEYYEKDLRMALEQVSELVEDLDGKVVVTADHGESFGEEYEWGHPIGSENPALVHVPWLVLDDR